MRGNYLCILNLGFASAELYMHCIYVYNEKVDTRLKKNPIHALTKIYFVSADSSNWKVILDNCIFN
jgi:hypothetical protein